MPASFPATVMICLHRRLIGPVDGLPEILARRTALPVRPLAEGKPLPLGEVVVPGPGAALRAGRAGGWIAETTDDHPIDRSLEALSAGFGARLLAVVLTGRLNDGAAGARVVKRHGGWVLAQDPLDAEAPAMPSAAIATGHVDLVLPLSRVAHSLVALAMAPGPAELLRTTPAAWAG